jgi:hypothetical protein
MLRMISLAGSSWEIFFEKMPMAWLSETSAVPSSREIAIIIRSKMHVIHDMAITLAGLKGLFMVFFILNGSHDWSLIPYMPIG